MTHITHPPAPSQQKKKDSRILLIILLLVAGYFFFVWFFGYSTFSAAPAPIVMRDSIHREDQFFKHIHYDLFVVSSVYYSGLVPVWTRNALKDSLAIVQSHMLEDRFRDKYPSMWDEKGCAYEYVVMTPSFSFGSVDIDSSIHIITIQKKLKPQKWLYTPSSIFD